MLTKTKTIVIYDVTKTTCIIYSDCCLTPSEGIFSYIIRQMIPDQEIDIMTNHTYMNVGDLLFKCRCDQLTRVMILYESVGDLQRLC